MNLMLILREHYTPKYIDGDKYGIDTEIERESELRSLRLVVELSPSN